MTTLILRGTAGDQGEATAWSLSAITEEHLAAVGHLLTAQDVPVAHAMPEQLRRRYFTQIEPKAVVAVTDDRTGHVREESGDLRSHLVALLRNRRTEECGDVASILEVGERGDDDALVKPTPTGVHDGEAS